ncbi:glycosyltransferase [Rhizobium sp. TRM95111]|uniref:glycosyltransferase n=1 Tax=Rhizobium alarense TaxID=2846851 RepID=UPI001F2A2ADB|nr:glycosyltransferase [Rhizobium alarense]MCF3638475.1 glycosyltransferase [Rhizobium alarense]
MPRVYIYPAITQKVDADNLISRLSWYFQAGLESIDEIVLCGNKMLTDQVSVPDFMDPGLKILVPRLTERVSIVAEDELQRRIIDADVVRDILLIWDTRVETGMPVALARSVDAFRKSGGLYRVDALRTRMEGSFYLWASLNRLHDPNRLEELNRHKMAALLKDVGAHSKAYVFGTGPSFSEFVQANNFEDGICIVSNSIVKNAGALARLKPKIICAADPIYHAGCSKYAATFRSHLVDAMRHTGAWLLCPLRDYPIYDAFLPAELKERLVAVPFVKGDGAAIDLSIDFHVRPYPNVLTLLLLPLAATIASEICIVGCDGRKLLDDSFFWAHDRAVQFHGEMADIRAAHPAFFEIDYNDYYLDHCRDLEVVLSAIERKGRRVVTLTPSLIPALHHRFITPPTEGEVLRCIAMLDPDATSDWGHFLAYDKRLGSAARDHGASFALLCRRELKSEFRPSSADLFVPIFGVHSWTIGNKSPANRLDVLTFARELEAGLVQVEKSFQDEHVCVFCYIGSPEIAEVVEHLLTYRPRFRAVVNLFWCYNFDQNESSYSSSWRPTIARLAQGRQVRVTHSTPQISHEYQRDWNVAIPVLPHPSTAFSDIDAARRIVSYARLDRAESKNPWRVVFPGGARQEKGYMIALDASIAVAKDLEAQVVLRANIDKVSGWEIAKKFSELDKGSLEILDGPLSDDEFVGMLSDADVVVIPYSGEAFRRRTSGILIDAMILGKPAVVVTGTWLADFVVEHGIGVACEADAQAIATAVRQVTENYATYCARVERACTDYIRENSWGRLVEMMASTVSLRADKSEDFATGTEIEALRSNFVALHDYARRLECDRGAVVRIANRPVHQVTIAGLSELVRSAPMADIGVCERFLTSLASRILTAERNDARVADLLTQEAIYIALDALPDHNQVKAHFLKISKHFDSALQLSKPPADIAL